MQAVGTRLQGRVALVTGAAQGIGRGVAERFAGEGATLIISDIDTVTGEATARALKAEFHRQNVASEDEWKGLLEAIEQRHGALHVLVNNAGTEGDPAAPKTPEQTPLEDWNRIFAVNAAGVFLGCKHAIPLLARSGGGAIVNMSSVASMVPTPFLTAYGAAKSAVEQLTRSVALHCARAGYRITANSVHPGQVRTQMLEVLFDRLAGQAGISRQQFDQNFLASIPLGCYQEPVDIANAVLFFASSEARYVTGQSMAVDGGFVLAN
jgi:3(or 17)beta-hydroxysteroid dehydrogenase